MGDITAVFSVLVEGSDMEEPIADAVRGLLDGHVVLDRAIAERGRFPAIDIGASVSRSLPIAASADENALLQEARSLLRSHDDARLMLQSGLYTVGGDPHLDRAVALYPRLDAFLAARDLTTPETAFAALRAILGDD